MSSTTLLSSVTNNVSSTLGPNVSTSTLEPSVTPNFTITTLFPPNSTLFPNDTNLTTDGYRPETPEEALRDFWIGLCLAVTSAVFTGSSFILKKKGLLNVSKRSATRAGMYVYSKTCVKRTLSKRKRRNGFQDRLSLNQCRSKVLNTFDLR